MCAGLAVFRLQEILERTCAATPAIRGVAFAPVFQSLATKYDVIGDIRGKGGC